jgi:hypothetical protein
MASEREQNGPTQVHPALNYNDLTAHMQLNGMNGLNGIGIMNKSFGERGELIFTSKHSLESENYLLIVQKLYKKKF